MCINTLKKFHDHYDLKLQFFTFNFLLLYFVADGKKNFSDKDYEQVCFRMILFNVFNVLMKILSLFL